jgi:hypothetical protein
MTGTDRESNLAAANNLNSSAYGETDSAGTGGDRAHGCQAFGRQLVRSRGFIDLEIPFALIPLRPKNSAVSQRSFFSTGLHRVLARRTNGKNMADEWETNPVRGLTMDDFARIGSSNHSPLEAVISVPAKVLANEGNGGLASVPGVSPYLVGSCDEARAFDAKTPKCG